MVSFSLVYCYCLFHTHFSYSVLLVDSSLSRIVLYCVNANRWTVLKFVCPYSNANKDSPLSTSGTSANLQALKLNSTHKKKQRARNNTWNFPQQQLVYSVRTHVRAENPTTDAPYLFFTVRTLELGQMSHDVPLFSPSGPASSHPIFVEHSAILRVTLGRRS